MQTGPPLVIKITMQPFKLAALEVDFTKFTSDQFGFLSVCPHTG